MKEKQVSPLYRAIKGLLRLLYPKFEVVGAEHLPQESCIIVGNHSQMNGPIACELYFPIERYTWCNAEMLHLKEVPAYAYRDFWSQKPRRSRWFYKILSYIIAPIAAFVLSNANTIGVRHDARILSTFRETMDCLASGASVVIFPEKDGEHEGLIYNFQDGFVDVARLYHRKTGRILRFVPLYIAPRLKRMYLGAPIAFRPESSPEEERRRISGYLRQEIAAIARSLPRHRVVPYRNIPRRLYPYNKADEEN